MKKLPKYLKTYFWDVEFEDIDLDKRRIFILKRILEYGNEQAVHWMWKNFDKSEMINALSNYRGYSKKSANYWAIILDIPKENVLCLKKHSSKIQRTFWPH